MDAVLLEYNGRCFRTAGICLAARGFFPGAADPLSETVSDDIEDYMDDRQVDRWSADWIKAFHLWQKVQYGVENPWDWIKTAKWGSRLMDEQSPYITNQNGDVYVPVPVSKFRQSGGFTVEISFAEFVRFMGDREGYDSKRYRLQAQVHITWPFS